MVPLMIIKTTENSISLKLVDTLQSSNCCELFGVIGTPIIVIIHPEGEHHVNHTVPNTIIELQL